MEQRDFSVRYEVKMMLEETMDIQFTDEQIDKVVEEIESYETFLNVLSVFILKGIETVAEEENITLDENEVQHQYDVARKGINYSDL